MRCAAEQSSSIEPEGCACCVTQARFRMRLSKARWHRAWQARVIGLAERNCVTESLTAARSTPTRSCPRFIEAITCSRWLMRSKGQPILSAQDVEDVVEFLTTLRTPAVLDLIPPGLGP